MNTKENTILVDVIPMIKIKRLHHIAIICSDYKKSLKFYSEVLGFNIDVEVYRQERQSYKADLSLNGHYVIELFSFPSPPGRLSRPEATGLRHIAFEVENLKDTIQILEQQNVISEPIRVDEFTNKNFTFIFDPDNLPIELYENEI